MKFLATHSENVSFSVILSSLARMTCRYGFLILCIFFFFSEPINAGDATRIVTIVHPVRSRAMWKHIEAMQDQIRAVTDRQLPVTWLLQYDVLSDEPVVQLLKGLPADHEIGIFLEVDQTLARDALVPYIIGRGDWARADKVLLSGYEAAERKRMIDRLFTTFYQVFGYLPVSVGAWYVDALSSDYLSTAYATQAVMVVADQFQTDGYGLWGQPWGTPYYPSRLQPLAPARESSDQLPMVKTQWAARDIVRGYGLGVSDSIYSVQANDYAGQGLSTEYFQKLLRDYLWAPNALNQVTVGIEVGQEGRAYLPEYQRQMEVLGRMRHRSEVEILTMKQFADLYWQSFPQRTPDTFVSGADHENPQRTGYWYASPWYRVGLLNDNGQLNIRDLRSYTDAPAAEDVMKKDREEKLKRIVPTAVDDARFDNARVLLEQVETISVQRRDDEIVLDTVSDDNSKHALVLRPQEIVFDGRMLWNVRQERSIGERVRQTLASGMLTYAHVLPHQWNGGIRFSSIAGIDYAGIWLYPEYLYGVSTQFPYFGQFHFPFSVLSHFRAPPKIDPVQWMWPIVTN